MSDNFLYLNQIKEKQTRKKNKKKIKIKKNKIKKNIKIKLNKKKNCKTDREKVLHLSR